MVLEEVNRLSAKLNQLLQFSRPAVLGQPVEARCDVGEVLREVTEVLRPEAEHRGVTLERSVTSEPLIAAIGREALNDIVTNLLVNALDAVSPRGRIQVGASNSDGWCTLLVETAAPAFRWKRRTKSCNLFSPPSPKAPAWAWPSLPAALPRPKVSWTGKALCKMAAELVFKSVYPGPLATRNTDFGLSAMQAAPRSLPKTEIVSTRPVLFLAVQPPLAGKNRRSGAIVYVAGKSSRQA
jgi:hypothetical protein